MSKVTVFMPVYNAEKYLNEAIDSVLNQTYKDFELLIIDNCSTDNSVSLVEKYHDSRIKLIVNDKNIGLTGSRNKALEVCNSEYIALLDADDIALPNRLKREVEYLDVNKNIAAIGGYTAIIYENGYGKDMFRPQLINCDYLRSYMIFNNAIANGSTMIRKSVIDDNKIRYEDNCYGVEDYKFWCDVLKFGNIANIGEIFLKYRVVSNSVSALANSDKLDERKRVIREIQKDNIEFYNFEFSDRELNVLLEVFQEDGIIKSYEDIEVLYGALKSMTSQAYLKKLSFAKEVETMCRKRFGEKIAKAMFLWNGDKI